MRTKRTRSSRGSALRHAAQVCGGPRFQATPEQILGHGQRRGFRYTSGKTCGPDVLLGRCQRLFNDRPSTAKRVRGSVTRDELASNTSSSLRRANTIDEAQRTRSTPAGEDARSDFVPARGNRSPVAVTPGPVATGNRWGTCDVRPRGVARSQAQPVLEIPPVGARGQGQNERAHQHCCCSGAMNQTWILKSAAPARRLIFQSITDSGCVETGRQRRGHDSRLSNTSAVVHHP